MSRVTLSHIGRYKDIVQLLLRHAGTDAFKGGGLDEGADPDDTPPEAVQLAADLEEMGPTFIKLGQLLSTRADLLPPAYLKALSRLQDDVEPFPVEQAEEIVASELGVRLSKAFSDWDPEPIAAASLAQVHKAALRNGRLVAVKVQRPGIRERITEDMDALQTVTEQLDRHTDVGRHYRFSAFLDEFRRSLLRELDFQTEARNLQRLGQDLRDYDRLLVPQPVEDYTTTRVLTMDFVKARKVTELGPLGRMELDGVQLADQLFRAYLTQILVNGFFHADPHPGNVLLTEDDRLALLDLGMVARITPQMQEHLVRLLIAVGEARVEETAEVTMRLGQPRRGFDRERFQRRLAELLARVHDLDAGETHVGTLVMEVSRVSAEEGLRPPPELALLGKTMLNLDEVGHILDPDFNPNASIRRHVGDILSRRLWREASAGTVLDSVLELKEFVQELPGRVNKIMDTVAEGRFEVKVDAVDEQALMVMFQKVANRVASGVVLAALILGAALLMRVETPATIFGYPALAMILFLAAALSGFGLLISIFFTDEHHRRHR
ncbi:MAG TPA: AarF/UbiB family protein [Egibacteraceae bacterium]|jgi:ubiquinone biosynthesis protein|nr:AarF/UbiB family protein [Egibacteraceae bacterium]